MQLIATSYCLSTGVASEVLLFFGGLPGFDCLGAFLFFAEPIDVVRQKKKEISEILPAAAYSSLSDTSLPVIPYILNPI